MIIILLYSNNYDIKHPIDLNFIANLYKKRNFIKSILQKLHK